MKSEIDVQFINKISYPDFVGLINQWNVLPGALSTISEWVVFSKMDAKSYILEVACTTGFSSRELAQLTGCSGIAYDLSNHSVHMANYNKQHFAKGININYIQADGYEFTSKKNFSHIVIGASLKFFPDPKKILANNIEMLCDEGYILASPFFTVCDIPKNKLAEAKKIFGITPTVEKYKEIMKIYKGLEIVYESRKSIFQETEEEMQHYTESTVNRACKMLGIKDNKVKTAMYNRLLNIKRMSNDLRPYQNYTVLVLRYRKNIYPNRYIELF